MEKEEIFKKYQGNLINIATTLWDTWEYRNHPCFQYLSKEDIIQEAYLKFLKIIDKISGKKTKYQQLVYVNQSIKNHILNYFRHLTRKKNLATIEHTNLDSVIADEDEYEIQKEVINKFFDLLNQNEKKCVSLMISKLSDAEIAEKLHWADYTVEIKKARFAEILKDIENEYR